MVIITLADVLENKGMCNSACYAARLSGYYDDVFQDVCIKAVNEKLHFDETRGVKKSTYLYSVFYNTAADYKRKLHYQKETLEDHNKEEFVTMAGGSHDVRVSYAKDGRVVMREALNRLVVECEKKTIELLVRYVLLGEDREALADEYNMLPNNVSVLKSRWWPRLIGLGKEVAREDVEGTLKVSPNRLDFLKPYLEWI